MFEVTHVYQLTPPPPELYTVNEYIVAAQTWHDLRFFAFFLHHIEPRLNGRVTNFLLREGLDRYAPERFLDYKQNCVLAMLECLESYDPYKGAEFLRACLKSLKTPFVGSFPAMLRCDLLK